MKEFILAYDYRGLRARHGERQNSKGETCGRDRKLRAHNFKHRHKTEEANRKWGEVINFQSPPPQWRTSPSCTTSPNTTSNWGPSAGALVILCSTQAYSGTLMTTHLLLLIRVRASQMHSYFWTYLFSAQGQSYTKEERLGEVTLFPSFQVWIPSPSQEVIKREDSSTQRYKHAQSSSSHPDHQYLKCYWYAHLIPGKMPDRKNIIILKSLIYITVYVKLLLKKLHPVPC